MGWDGPILTDSGGFQLFSLAQNDQGHRASGAVFRSHIDGSLLELTPERAVADSGRPGQRRGDGARPRDRACPATAEVDSRRRASARSAGPRAASRRPQRADQAQFAIVQGGLDPELRVQLRRAAGRRSTSPATPSAD